VRFIFGRSWHWFPFQRRFFLIVTLLHSVSPGECYCIPQSKSRALSCTLYSIRNSQSLYVSVLYDQCCYLTIVKYTKSHKTFFEIHSFNRNSLDRDHFGNVELVWRILILKLSLNKYVLRLHSSDSRFYAVTDFCEHGTEA
jgi:hypothetical protein